MGKIMQLTSAYEDVNRKLGASVQQYDVTIRKLTELDVSYKKITADYNKSLTVIKDYELKLNGFNGKVNELTTANNQLVMVKTKLEKEFGQVSKDYDDIARELKLADDRANKASADAGHFESLLREEQAKLVKIDQAKKSLENEVRSLSVRIEEIETNSVATSKRTIQKMEVRIEELEEQESISNSNIMRVKKFQRELESAENRAEEAESTLNQFRSRERVFASASARSEKSTDVQETEVVVKKTINRVNIGSSSVEESSSSALASRDVRAGSVAGAVSYSRAGSVARAGSTYRGSSMARAGSMARASSSLRY